MRSGVRSLFLARIAGVNLPNQKRLEIGLTYIYGIGPATAREICAKLGLDPNEKVRDLTDDEVNKLRGYIDRRCASRRRGGARCSRSPVRGAGTRCGRPPLRYAVVTDSSTSRSRL